MAGEETKPLIPIPALIGLLVVAGIATAGYLYVKYGMARAEPAPLTAEAKAYTRNLKLANVEMKAHESYLGQAVVEITGTIANAGDRDVRHVELTCIFYDPYAQVVRRLRVPIVKATSGGLKVGATKSFRLPFDDIPESWNQTMPQLVIAQILF
ncbi:MAG: FxLYD domain-containing protein [Bryobacteraceae bacterium]